MLQRATFGSALGRRVGGQRCRSICRDKAVYALLIRSFIRDAGGKFLDLLSTVRRVRFTVSRTGEAFLQKRSLGAVVGRCDGLDHFSALFGLFRNPAIESQRVMRRRSFSWGLLAAWLTSCQSRGKQISYAVLDRQSTQLKHAFNADRGKVRVLMLVSPT